MPGQMAAIWLCCDRYIVTLFKDGTGAIFRAVAADGWFVAPLIILHGSLDQPAIQGLS